MEHASLHSPARQAAPANGRVLGLTRAGILGAAALAAANGLFLYLFPGRARLHYAWSIRPAVNAAFIGAGFLAGTLATGLVLAMATRWRSFSLLPPALWVLATTLLAATIIHEDRFRWDYPPTWVWTLVYAGVPGVRFWSRGSGGSGAAAGGRPALRPCGVLSATAGVRGLIAGAAALYRRAGRARRALAVAADAAALPRRRRVVCAVRDDAAQLRLRAPATRRGDHRLRHARRLERAAARAAAPARRRRQRRRALDRADVRPARTLRVRATARAPRPRTALGLTPPRALTNTGRASAGRWAGGCSWRRRHDEGKT